MRTAPGCCASVRGRGQTRAVDAYRQAALAIVGCGEVAQIMRGHVMTIRNEQFIEAARAIGLNAPQILSRHVLPNLMSSFDGLKMRNN